MFNASMIISGLQLNLSVIDIRVLIVVVFKKCTLVCDICLLRSASVLMTNTTMTTHCWGYQQEKGVLNYPSREHLVTEQRRGNTITDLDRRAQQGAGTRSLLDPDCFTVTLQWAMGSSPLNKTHSCPFCSRSHSTHMLLQTHFTAYCCLTLQPRTKPARFFLTVASTIQTYTEWHTQYYAHDERVAFKWDSIMVLHTEWKMVCLFRKKKIVFSLFFWQLIVFAWTNHGESRGFLWFFFFF